MLDEEAAESLRGSCEGPGVPAERRLLAVAGPGTIAGRFAPPVVPIGTEPMTSRFSDGCSPN